MPELPEVETIARQLQGVLPGRKISQVEVLREKSFGGAAMRLGGRLITHVHRKAKNIIITFDDENIILFIHLKMTGQLIWCETKGAKNKGGQRIVGGHPTADWVQSLPSKHTRVMIHFNDGSTLFFNDQRVFGWVKIITQTEFSMLTQRLPPDVVDKEYTIDYLTKVLKNSSRPIKLVLLDQAKIGGLGNIYVNDALYLAGTKPTRKSNSLTKTEIARIYKATIQVINRGIETGGASESTYKHINGMGGKYQEEFLIYKREGLVCGKKDCQGTIQKIRLGGRGTYFCPLCQR